MTEITIDNSKLPGVKEVVRDFGVLEDHTLAHTLQEQEIEHHLSTNIQRNRLVKHDLKVAKQLQEEEDLRAQTRLKKQHNELELLDVEIAQEIQEKLVIDAERRRRQEEKDEDIARLLQEREEKRKRSSREESQCSNHEGLRQREIRDAQQTKPSSGPKTREEYDAEIARKLQERELKVNVLDLQAAQLAQDEEIARWLMEKEEKAYRKSKSKEKMSDRRRPEEREPRSQEYVRPGTRESKESHRSRSDKPYRPLPPFPDEVGECDFEQDYTNRNQHNSPRSNSKSQSSHKGSSYRP
uniref:Coiled-coil domain containing 50 n=1 Tax=Leptobrachium leishanense TaxID=445787 RepID=A0A8C5QM47_9ANUR